jgi:uncharacterized membrane protein
LLPQISGRLLILIYTHHEELMKSVDSYCSLALLFMLMVLHQLGTTILDEGDGLELHE